MSGFRLKDSKREEYRKYLERAGVMDALTKILVMLYEEPDKPDDALEYVRGNLGDNRPSAAEIEILKYDLQNAQQRVEQLEEENENLKRQLAEANQNMGEFSVPEEPTSTENEVEPDPNQEAPSNEIP